MTNHTLNKAWLRGYVCIHGAMVPWSCWQFPQTREFAPPPPHPIIVAASNVYEAPPLQIPTCFLRVSCQPVEREVFLMGSTNRFSPKCQPKLDIWSLRSRSHQPDVPRRREQLRRTYRTATWIDEMWFARKRFDPGACTSTSICLILFVIFPCWF